MTVRAVRPRVPAIHGLVHRHDCAGDCCNYDEFTDSLATGDPYSPEWPDKPLRLKPSSTNVASPITPLAASPDVLDIAPGSLRPTDPERPSSPPRSGSKADTTFEDVERPGDHRDAP